MGGQRLAFGVIGRMPVCLVNSARPGAHCGLRRSESVELLGDEYRDLFCEYGSAGGLARKLAQSWGQNEKSSLMVLLRDEGRVFQDDDIAVSSAGLYVESSAFLCTECHGSQLHRACCCSIVKIGM